MALMIEDENWKVDSLEAFNGVYSNDAKGINWGKNETLWYQFKQIDVKEKYKQAKNAKVKFEVAGRRKINAILSVKDTPIEMKTLKGNFKNGVFVLKRRSTPHGIPLINFYHKEAVSMLSLEKGKVLQVHTTTYKYGGWFLFYKGKKTTKVMEYRKKRKKK